MVNLAIAFLCAAIICGSLGFGLEAGLASMICGALFMAFLTLFVIVLLFGRRIAGG